MMASNSLRGIKRIGTRRGAFSLVELLTVIFIIALLIGILVPSLQHARNYAKGVATSKGMDSIKVGLEMFKNENGSDFAQTNGYPPSFAHPPLTAFGSDFTSEDALAGRFPFMAPKPIIYGAHWLPAMLMGVNELGHINNSGYIKRSAVPKTNPPISPFEWYSDDIVAGKRIDRAPLYVTSENAPIKKTEQLAGRRPADEAEFFSDWDSVRLMSVFVDGWDQPILYYAANTAGKATNLVETVRKQDNAYGPGNQKTGPPYYFHQDNAGFTGKSDSADLDTGTPGWQLSGSNGKHAIMFHGADLEPKQLLEVRNKECFARYVVDRKIYSAMESIAEQSGLDSILPTTPLRPVNADTYLLISAGVDGRFGTQDDISNMPPFASQ